MRTRIGVLGGNVAPTTILKEAEEVGRLIAEKGAVLVCGGRGGVMEAACRGARAAGGLTVGILPGDDPREANPYIDIPIVTGMGIARNALVVKSSDGLIAIDGKYGTLSEIAFALQLGIPVVGLHTWDILGGQMVAGSPKEAVEKIFQLIGRD
jgi:hypothetical protein